MPTPTLIQGPPRQAGTGLLLAIIAGGCESGTAPSPREPVLATQSAIISDSAALDTPVAYVSFVPGSFPAGSRITIMNRHTAASLTTGTVGGGLDPIPVPAVAGDFLAFAIDTGGPQTIGFTQMVPTATPPSVVRTEPGAGIADAPIDALVRVVFSEPVIPDMVRDALGVMQNGNLVDATVEVSPDGLSATIVPTEYLRPSTAYTISVGSDLQDADGSGMPETVTAAFATAGLPFTGTFAFASDSGIHLINADGTNLRQLTVASSRFSDNYPAWSPNGDRIAFERFDGQAGQINVFSIYVIAADGTGLVRLSAPFPTAGSDEHPTWSPDGQRIAFINTSDSLWPYSRQIYVMNADGTNRVPITALSRGAEMPTWSPDGNRFAFMGYGSSLSEDICIVDVDGTNLVNLTNDTDFDWMPAWSPDGSRIAFERNGYVFLVDQDGTHLEQFSTGFAGSPAWSPDGRYVVFGQGGTMWIGSVTDRRMVPIAEGRSPSWGP